MKFDEIDGCPVPRSVAPAIREIKQASGATLVSAYRGSDLGAASILRRFGKSTQAALRALFLAGRGNPANPVGFSTHELFNDGVAYRLPRGVPLRAYQIGLDWAHPGGAAAVCEAAARRGYAMTVTYPSNPRERHHANLRKPPRIPFSALKLGARGARVEKLTRRLMIARRPVAGHRPYLSEPSRTYTPRVRDAVRLLQRDHGQKPDGAYGAQTHAQLMTSVRFQIRKLKKEKR